MAIIKNPDGTFTVTTPDGQIISANVPPSLVSAQPPIPEPVPVASPDQPPPEPVPVAAGTPAAVPLGAPPTLFNEPGGPPPPTALESGQAVAQNAPLPITGIAPGPAPGPKSMIPPTPPAVGDVQAIQQGLGVAPAPPAVKIIPAKPPEPVAAPVAAPPLAPKRVGLPPDVMDINAPIAGNQVVIPVGGGGGVRKVPEKLVPKGGVLSQVRQMPVLSPEEQSQVATMRAQLEKEKDPQVRAALADQIHQIETVPSSKLHEEMAFQNLLDTYNANAAEKGAYLSDTAAEFAKQKDIADSKVAEIAKQQRQREEQLRPRLEDLENRQQELASMKVDPEHYWNNKSAFSKVVAVIAMGLGGWEAGLKGGPNKVYDMIHNAINEDIGAQKSNIEKKKAEADISSNVLSQMQRMWMSPEAAESATRALMAESAAAEAAKQAAGMQGLQAKQNADALIAMLRLDHQQQKDAAAQAEAGVLQTQSVLVPEHMAGGGGINVRSTMKKNMSFYKELYPDDPDKAREEATKATALEVSLRTGRRFGVEEAAPAEPGAIKLTKKQQQEVEVAKKKNEMIYPGGGGRYGSMAQAQLQKDTLKAAGDLTKISRQLENYRQEMYKFLDYRNNPLKIAAHPMDTLKSIDYAKTASKEAAGQFMSSFMGKTDQGWKISKSLTDGPSVFARKSEVDAAVDEGINRAVDVYLGMRRAAGMPKMTKEQVLAGEFPEGIKEKEAEAPEVPGATPVGGGSEGE